MKKVPTLVDVAKLANTSKATAARVFSRSKSANVKLETKARILEAADKLGYSQLVRGKPAIKNIPYSPMYS